MRSSVNCQIYFCTASRSPPSSTCCNALQYNMQNSTDPPPTKRMRLPTASGAQSADDASMQRALSHDDSHNAYAQVEAFGSGALLHAGLGFPSNCSVGTLRKIVLASIAVPRQTLTVRLFVGHGGTELDDDEMLVSDSPVAVDCEDTPLVALNVLCTPRRIVGVKMMG